ncbi:PAS domain-containing protein [Chondromyces apiculatus]|uniref:Putative PAS/PAC sensor protein n=1 Tax=Chondromyces apiculatus DSM 436 TaxID=1192034 RepID=A0A017TBY8_9BACT|nr:PAS domain-containing protein [Chondromyces apiculatus]EYF06101.1 putative PAS/PAC sensor protein [Chondromyces apiculatus DSM 436]
MVTVDDDLRTEVARLKARVATLERTVETVTQERDELRCAILQMPALIAIVRGKELVFSLANQHWLDSVIGTSEREVLGRSIRDVLPEIGEQGFYDLFDGVLTTGKTFLGECMPVDLDRTGTGVLERKYYTFHYIAHRGPDDEIIGVIVHAADVTSEFLARQEVQRLNTKLSTFFALAENAPDGITVTVDGKIIYANPAFRDMTGHGETCLGKSHEELVDEVSREVLREAEETTEEAWRGMLTYLRSDGSAFLGQASGFAIRDEAGGIRAIGTILRDLTEQRHSEEEREALREQVLAAHQRAIRELSSPLIPLADGLVVMPLLGTIDASRARQIMETLLEGISGQRARIAILDVTGVRNVDVEVANALVKTAQAANLLGTEVVLTGISPDVARILVEIGANLGTMKTRGTLQSAVAYAMGKPTADLHGPAHRTSLSR